MISINNYQYTVDIYLHSLTAPDDYATQNTSLTFNSVTTQLLVPVPIVDDELDEEDEERFTALLNLVTNNPRVTIDPAMAEVLIVDNDGK